MTSFLHSFALPALFTRSFAIAALMGATMLASPLTSARANGAEDSAVQPAQVATPHNPAAAGATKMKGESVEQRIENLHTALKITPDEETNWMGVAQAMRENSAAMQKLVAEKTVKDPQTLTAVDSLKIYEQFARAHVDGLKNLSASFETLYNSMPDPQKKIADDVFRSFGRKHGRSHS